MTNADKVATLMVLINSNWFCRTRTTACCCTPEILKIKNQRATLLYFKKYHQLHKATIEKTAERLNNILAQIKCRKWQDFDKWNEILNTHHSVLLYS
jgi:hypothetical protein